MFNGQVMGCLSQAGGELKDHWAHFQFIFLRGLCLFKIVQVLINAVTGKVAYSTGCDFQEKDTSSWEKFGKNFFSPRTA
jgi:hypothetical protein